VHNFNAILGLFFPSDDAQQRLVNVEGGAAWGARLPQQRAAASQADA
jgi:hypothetical protein